MENPTTDDPFDPSPPAEDDAARGSSSGDGIGSGGAREAVREHAPGLARIYAGAWLRSAGWVAETSVKIGTGLARAAVSGQPPGKVFDETTTELRAAARRFLGLGGGDAGSGSDADNGDRSSDEELREHGAALLRHSADVRFNEDTHPAYERILHDITPDEARILRLFATDGPQPAIDVRTFGPFGIGSELVAQGQTMIGAEAGCRHTDRVPAYMNNLNRLGLVWFSRETLDELQGYQVLEAQPEATDALKEAGRGAQTVRRSIDLTAFGRDFCESVLPDDTAEFEAVRAGPVELGDEDGAGVEPGAERNASRSDGQ